MDLSIIEAIYVIYMLRYFKTTLNINHSFENNITNISDYFLHPINSQLYESKICQFGKDASLLIGFYLIIRFLLKEYMNIYKPFINKLITGIILICSFMNMNAFFYLLPFFIYEFIIYYFIIIK
jgi:hypothetical protein